MDTLKRLTIALVLTLSVSSFADAQVVWRSITSGNWGALATWERSTDGGGTWAAPTALPATADTASDFIITAGTTVVVEATPKYCGNLTVQSGAVLRSNLKQPTSNIRYLRIKGSTMTVDGVLGFPAAPADSSDVLSLQVYSTTLTIQGSGLIRICRLRPHAGRVNNTVVFDTDAIITYIGSTGTGGAGIYSANDTLNDNFTMTVNAGRTLTMVDQCNLATSSSTSSDGTASTTFNIDGTVNMLGGNLNLRGAAGKSIVLNVAGTLNVGGSVYPTGTTGVASTINVTGTMNTGTLGKGTLYFDAPAQAVTGSGTFTVGAGANLRIGATAGLDAATGPFQTTVTQLSPDANYAFLGTSAQGTGDLLPAHVRALTVDNAAGVTLANTLLVDTLLALTNGGLITGPDSLILSPAANVSRTNGHVAGHLTKLGFTGRKNFEVGTAYGYSPVAIDAASGTGNATVTAVDGVHPNIINGFRALGRNWNIGVTGITSADLTFHYQPSDVQGDESAYRAGRQVSGTQWATYPTTVDPGGDSATVFGVTTFSDWTLGEPGAFTAWMDPASISVVNAEGTVTLDGRLDEAEWASSPTLLFGPGAHLKQGAGEQTVTSFVDVKAIYDYWDNGVFYGTFRRPNTDSSLAKVKFIRKGMKLYVGITSDDKSVCKFDWEGDGLFFKIKRSNGTDTEYKLYYQNIGTAADTIRYEEQFPGWGAGAGVLAAGSTANDTANTDSSIAYVSFLRKGMNLYVGVTSNDPSICKFDWEGEGLFFKIKRANGTDTEYKLYYQNIGTAADTIRYEEQFPGWGAGAGFLPAGSTANDTSDTDNGYSAELLVRIDSLGFAAGTDSLLIAMAVFDPDGYQHPMNSYDTLAGSFYKSWWGSEWGGVYRTLTLTAEPVKFNDPDTLFALTATTEITIDGVLGEPEWTNAATLAFGNGAFLAKPAGAQTVTGEADIKATYDYWDNGVLYGTFHRPNTDSSLTLVKVLRKGANLFFGISSNDESICKFDWEGDGIFLKIRRSNGSDTEFKLYYQNIGTAADTIRFEPQFAGWGMGAGQLASGSTVNDTTNVDNGYTAELMVRLDSLGWAPSTQGVQLSMAIFDPDGYQHPMNSYDTLAGSYYKSWWGSEWGGVWRVVAFDDLVGVEVAENGIPDQYALQQNFPNPFNPSTQIRFALPTASTVRIAVFDVTGREVGVPAMGDYVAGVHTVPFDARHLASGVYFYRMTATGKEGNSASFVATNKLVLVK